jgi:hypothetical protein
MHINIILYKITYHISILAIQCIQGVFGTVVFQGYSIAMLLSRPSEDFDVDCGTTGELRQKGGN